MIIPYSTSILHIRNRQEHVRWLTGRNLGDESKSVFGLILNLSAMSLGRRGYIHGSVIGVLGLGSGSGSGSGSVSGSVSEA